MCAICAVKLVSGKMICAIPPVGLGMIDLRHLSRGYVWQGDLCHLCCEVGSGKIICCICAVDLVSGTMICAICAASFGIICDICAVEVVSGKVICAICAASLRLEE